ncbi:hypothetical protein PFISCL1PPCAC_21583, partial [Pristionchus fissidentatus]
VVIVDEEVSSPNAYCRFKVLLKKKIHAKSFYSELKRLFEQSDAALLGANNLEVKIHDYHGDLFKSLVPCNPDRFVSAGAKETPHEHISEFTMEETEY